MIKTSRACFWPHSLGTLLKEISTQKYCSWRHNGVCSLVTANIQIILSGECSLVSADTWTIVSRTNNAAQYYTQIKNSTCKIILQYRLTTTLSHSKLKRHCSIACQTTQQVDVAEWQYIPAVSNRIYELLTWPIYLQHLLQSWFLSKKHRQAGNL